MLVELPKLTERIRKPTDPCFFPRSSIISLVPRQFSHLFVTHRERERERKKKREKKRERKKKTIWRMTPTAGAWSSSSRYFRCQKAATSLSLRHQRLSFGFSSIRFSHREDRGLDDRNYTETASKKDVLKQIRACVHDLLRKHGRLIEDLNRCVDQTGYQGIYSILWFALYWPIIKYACTDMWSGKWTIFFFFKKGDISYWQFSSELGLTRTLFHSILISWNVWNNFLCV